MSCLSNEMRVFIKPWLDRVAMQFEPKAKKAEKKYDDYIAQENLATSRLFAAFITANQRPTVEQNGLFNKHNITNNTYINNQPSTSTAKTSSETEEAGKKKEKTEVSWKSIVAIAFVSTVVTSVSVFVYTRLGKAEEKAQNYLAKTKLIKEYAEKSAFANPYINALKEVASAQKDIDQAAVNKITNYKRVTLAALVGVITVTSGAIAMPWFAAAGTAASIFGIVIVGVSVGCAGRNLATHWSDEEDGKEKIDNVRYFLNQLKPSNAHREMEDLLGPQPAYNPDFIEVSQNDLPPSYAQSQELYGFGYVGTEGLYPTIPTNLKS